MMHFFQGWLLNKIVVLELYISTLTVWHLTEQLRYTIVVEEITVNHFHFSNASPSVPNKNMNMYFRD